MPNAGPELPPHLLAKRKRAAGEEDEARSGKDQAESTRPSSPQEAIKKRRVAGPAPPPAPLDERPPGNPDGNESNSSSDSDDYGPTLPPTTVDDTGSASKSRVSAFDSLPAEAPEEKGTKRAEWMLLPPKQDDLSARMDPTKIRARSFNTSKSAKSSKPGASDNAMWTETPEQKRKRLQDEVLGIKPANAEETAEDWKARTKRLKDEEKAREIREHNAKNRNQSLYDQHKRSDDKEEADDPSKRGFNYERDISAAPKVNHAQKREMINRAADFGSRFSKGSYL